MRRPLLLAALMLLGVATNALAAPCEHEDFERRVSGRSECLLMRRYGSTTPTTLVVWLHGNVSTGGPANSHFRVAEQVAAELAADNVLSVALVRPGYPDGTGESSSGNDYGRADNWPTWVVAEIGTVIERLRERYRPEALILVGHSGGAAISAVLLGMQPQLADSAVLLGCPCDMAWWRARRPQPPWVSEDPLKWVSRVARTTRVIALTGSGDATTEPGLAENYVKRLRARGVDAVFELVAGAGHIDLLRSPVVADAVSRLVRR